MALFFSWPRSSGISYSEYKKIVPKESKVDVENPPPEVCEAAADMGVSVEAYKDLYLNRPSFCENATRYYDDCVSMDKKMKRRRRTMDFNFPDCSHIMRARDAFSCDKFLEKYSEHISKYTN